MKWHLNPFQCKITEAFDPKYYLDQFETISVAKDRKEQYLKILKKGNRKARRLAKKLARCKKGRRCLSYACPECTRQFRRWLANQILDIFKNYEDVDLSHITIIPDTRRFPLGELINLSPVDMVNAFTRQLKRCGLGHCLVVGAIDFDLCIHENDESSYAWQPHYHVITAHVPDKKYSVFKRKFPVQRDLQILRPSLRRQIKNRMRQFTYMLKPFHCRRSSFYTAQGKLRHKKGLPLKPDHLRELLTYLDHFALTNFLVQQNVHRYGNVLKRKIPVDEKLSP